MNFNVHIERLVLDGLPVTSSDGSIIQVAVETELARLLAGQGLTGLSAKAVPHVPGGPIELARETKPAHLGHQIAQAIHTGLRPAPTTPRPRTSIGETSA